MTFALPKLLVSAVTVLVVAAATTPNARAQGLPYVVYPWQDPIIFVPQNLTRGDRDFAGHGPKITWSVNLWVNPYNRTEVWATIYMRAEETKKDWTTVWGSENRLVARAPRPILQILSPTYAGG